MQLLQQMPLNAAAAASARSAQRQQQGSELSDNILIAAACGSDAAGSSVRIMPAQQEAGAVQTVPMLQQVVPRMRLASAGTALGRPLLLNSSSAGVAVSNNRTAGVAGSSAALRHCHGRTEGQARAGARQSAHAVQQAGSTQGHAVSAAAADAEAAIIAAAAVRPWVASLMQLSSAQPGCGSSTLLGQPRADSNRTCAVEKGAPAAWRQSDTAQGRDVLSLSHKQQLKNGFSVASAAASSSSSSSNSSKTRQELEAQLVSIACLALQGVWSAVEQLWQLVLQGTQVEEDPKSNRRAVASIDPG
jgi:hypothetical protein